MNVIIGNQIINNYINFEKQIKLIKHFMQDIRDIIKKSDESFK